jgi:putative membrane protein
MSAWDLLAVAVLLLSGALYAAGQRRMEQRGSLRRIERCAFWAGWVVLLVAVLPPMDQMVASSFSAHMLQHELLMLVGVPLVIAGRPLAIWLWGMPFTLRAMVARVLQGPAVGGVWRALTAPAIAWALHGTVVWVWHVPRLYDMAVRNEAVHALQHAMFVGTSVLFWWGLVYGRYGRAGYGASVFYVFTTAVHTGILGAVFTLTSVPLYPVYAERATDPMSDQQLAGLVMWVPAGMILTLAGLGLFAAWLGEAERRSRRVLLLLLAVVLGTVACNGSNDQVARDLTGGEPSRGPQAIKKYGCDTCHTIPGVLTADATVGPPLTQVARRSYLAGRIENTPENMIQWIRHPHAVDNRTLMPEMGVSMQDGRDITAYLYTLR